jgi:lipopolysaccharide export LptBFGC system permease protein LptF
MKENEMVAMRGMRVAVWIAPVFLLGLVAAFILFPSSLMDKLHGVCFGI